MVRRLVNSVPLLWLLLAAPGVLTLTGYVSGDMFYGEVVHFTGELSARLLIVTLAVTPLRLLFPGRHWVVWLVRRRRYFGVATFGYAALHAGVYLARIRVPERILEEAVAPGLMTGWLALLIFACLAATSNDASVRRLKRWWKRLHRWVYIAAVLTFAHWLLEAFDIVPGLIHLSVLGALEGSRIWMMTRIRQLLRTR